MGLVLALVLYFFTTDPPRGGADGHHDHAHNQQSGLRAFAKDFKEVMKIRTFFWSTLGFTAVTFTSGALAQWAPTFVYRQSQRTDTPYSSTVSSLAFGGVTCFTGVVGTLSGSILSGVSLEKWV